MAGRELAVASIAALVGALVGGCAPASEDARLAVRVDERGSLIGVYAGTSAAGIEVDLDWAMVVRNLGASPCPVAVYRWTDALPEPASLPSLGASIGAGDWPTSWLDGELVEVAVVDADGSARFEASEPPADELGLLLGLAACPGARLELEVRAEVSADLGVRSIAEALTVELWRVEPDG